LALLRTSLLVHIQFKVIHKFVAFSLPLKVQNFFVLFIANLSFGKWCAYRSFSNGISPFLAIVLSNLLQALQNWLTQSLILYFLGFIINIRNIQNYVLIQNRRILNLRITWPHRCRNNRTSLPVCGQLRLFEAGWKMFGRERRHLNLTSSSWCSKGYCVVVSSRHFYFIIKWE
jgi:hypothetical protein